MGLTGHLNNFTTLTPPELSRAHSPAERERRKGAQQKAEDLIYTLNHAVTCLSLTDFLIAPFFSTVFGWNICGHGHDNGADGYASYSSGGGASFAPSTTSAGHVHGPWCNHDAVAKDASAEEFKAAFEKASMKVDKPELPKTRGGFSKLVEEGASEFVGPPRYEETAEFVGPPKSEHIKSPLPTPAPSYNSFHYSPPSPPPKPSVGQRVAAWWKELTSSPLDYLKKHYPGFKEWAIGEAVGDVGAVPVTLAIQHFTPGVMSAIQHGLEPIVGGLMHQRATRAAEKWADQNGIARDARECVDHAEELYRYEIRHLPQMVMWTVNSSAINYGVMKYRNPAMALGDFAKGKAAGAGITAALVLGARALAPERAHRWDETMGRKVVVPLTKKFGKLLGIEERDVDDYHARQNDDTTTAPKAWAQRVKDPANTAAEAARG